MHFTPISLAFVITSVVALLGSFLAWRRRTTPGATELSRLLLIAGYWAFCIIFETASSTTEGKIIWSKISYPGVVLTPVFYLIFVYRFIGRNRFKGFRNVFPLFIVPCLILLLAWTNESHHLIWTSLSPIHPETNLLQYFHGIVFMIGYVGYSYLLFVWGAILLSVFILKHKRTYRFQAVVIFLASLFPFLSSFVYLTKLNPIVGFDVTPLSICLSGILFIYAILHVKLLDLVPIAREVLVETLYEGILVIDEKERIQDINSAALRFLGIPHEKATGQEVQSLRVAYPELLAAVVSPENFESFVLEMEGRKRFFKINKMVLASQAGSRLVVVREITELLEKQVEIEHSGKRYKELYNTFRLMADNMPDLLWAKDLDLNYTFVNKAICNSMLKAKDTEEPIGKPEEYFLNRVKRGHPEDPDWFNIGEQSAGTDHITMLSGMPSVFDQYGNVDGNFYFFDVRKAPIYDEDGQMIGIVGSARDVTLQKKTESEVLAAKERAEESDRLKTSFLANMSHEIRTPMNSILGFITLLQEPDLTTSEKIEYLEIVKKGGTRLLNTINDIIDISRIESGQMNLMLGETDLSELFSLLLSVFKREAQEKNIQLVFTGVEPNGDAIIHTDKSKVVAVLSNLLKNALKYTKEGTVEFGCTLDAKNVLFRISDTGIGIPVERQKDIFDRFVQGDGSNTRLYEGSGLGLSISKAYVEMLGGTIWVESDGERGSTFYVKIPTNQTKEEENAPKPAFTEMHMQGQRRLRILVVEDDQANFDYLNLILKREKHEVHHTYTGFEAIEMCRQINRFDVVLMDVKLPGIDGYETTRRIRTFNIRIPIIAVSAFAFSEDQERAMESGCNEYITKPVNKVHLFRALEKVTRPTTEV
jgi:signal transduction histidine kinase/ActR/RegA family two-component response regulator